MGERVAVEVVAGEVAAAVEGWVSAHVAWLAAVRRRRQATSRAERRVVAATGGLGLARWGVVCRRRRIRSAADAVAVAAAVRARPAVEAAVAAQAALAAEHDAAVRHAEAALAAASQVVSACGMLAAGLCGIDLGELHRFASPGSAGPGSAGPGSAHNPRAATWPDPRCRRRR